MTFPMAVHLGFEIGSGTPVDIPIKHLAITGITQEAGKTTALEALITRSGMRAVTFITKRGEGSFSASHRIDPYFREQADWQFVASILEASRSEKLKFERPWIIRASKGARTLADVHRNVKKAMETAKGLAADVYLTLDAYLEVVVPQIGRIRWAPQVQLFPGVNAMDLTALSVEMQHLVIKSTLDWVLTHEEKTAVVVPEAWKFIPQGRGTPVKLAAEAFIRQGAALKNLLWLDSQDIAGIEKIILKSVPVWILGVQREANEIKRTLDNIPAGVSKPKGTDVATLDLGQFFVCWGRHCVKTYVQPIWLEEHEAKAVALLKMPPTLQPAENVVNEAEAERLRTRNADLEEKNRLLTQKVEDLSDAIARLRVGQSVSGIGEVARPTPPVVSVDQSQGRGSSQVAVLGDVDRVYDEIVRRLSKEPSLLRMLTVRPEIEMTVQRRTVTVDETSLKGRVVKLLAKGWFDQGSRQTEVKNELERTGGQVNNGNLYQRLQELVVDGFLTSEADKSYRSVQGMKVNIIEG